MHPLPDAEPFHITRWKAQERGERVFLMGWEDGRLVALGDVFWSSQYEEVLAAGQDCPEVHGLWVAPDRRGDGIGTAMLHEAERAARARGADCLALGVEVDNAGAERLYRRLGFEEWGGGLVEDRWSWTDRLGHVHHESHPSRYLRKPLR